MPSSTLADIYLHNINGVEEILLLGLAISTTMVAFSREKDEDEYTAAIRSRDLTLAFYVDLCVLIIATITINGLEFLNIIAIQMFLVLFIYIALFNTAMWRMRKLYKTSDYEK